MKVGNSKGGIGVLDSIRE